MVLPVQVTDLIVLKAKCKIWVRLHNVETAYCTGYMYILFSKTSHSKNTARGPTAAVLCSLALIDVLPFPVLNGIITLIRHVLSAQLGYCPTPQVPLHFTWIMKHSGYYLELFCSFQYCYTCRPTNEALSTNSRQEIWKYWQWMVIILVCNVC